MTDRNTGGQRREAGTSSRRGLQQAESAGEAPAGASLPRGTDESSRDGHVGAENVRGLDQAPDRDDVGA